MFLRALVSARAANADRVTLDELQVGCARGVRRCFTFNDAQDKLDVARLQRMISTAIEDLLVNPQSRPVPQLRQALYSLNTQLFDVR